MRLDDFLCAFIVGSDEVLPGIVSQLHGLLRRTDDVGEDNRREDAVDLGRRKLPSLLRRTEIRSSRPLEVDPTQLPCLSRANTERRSTD